MSFFEVNFQERQKGSLRREKTVVPEAGTKARQGEVPRTEIFNTFEQLILPL